MSDPQVALNFVGTSSDLSSEITRVSGQTKGLSDDVEKSSHRMADASEQSSGRMKSAISGAAAGAAGAISSMAIGGISQILDLGKSMDALDTKAKVVFQDQLPNIQAWAEQNKKAFGESSRNVVAMAANLTDLLKPMGFTAQQATEMSKQTLDLAGALSRWSGGSKSAAEVSEILSAAFLGERDALQGLGISISQNEVDTRVAENAKKGLKGATDQQSEALATQQLIMEKSTDAQKAWADGGKQAAEAQNGMKSSMQETAEKLAQVVQPAFAKLVEILGAVVDWISKNKEAALIIAGVTAAIWALNAAMNANPIVLVVTLIAGLVAAITILWTKSASFRQFFIDVWNGIKDTVGTVANWIRDRANDIGNFFAAIPRRIADAFGNIGDAIGRAFKSALNVAIDVINWFVDRANDIIYGINVVSPFDDIPYISHIARLHTGGEVPGTPGTEKLAILQAGERVLPLGSSGGSGGGTTQVIFGGDVDGTFATAFMNLVRTGQITIEVS